MFYAGRFMEQLSAGGEEKKLGIHCGFGVERRVVR
ncbi:hypothetical protein MTY_2090 [Moorella thermoacetica Y72]|uniref:Uncharacterized protein n=1 Tax=Moorella thermoacetica Y72 TaxID=1325331 RepID=A0A0S6UGR1_NEOTH|nr:hypothetical protein MTY_2090 [Moorella thermoacetica Y72]